MPRQPSKTDRPSIAALARAHGLKPDTLRKRLLTMSQDDALALPNQRPRREHPPTPAEPAPSRGRCRYCPTHEQIWYPGGDDEAGWMPFTRAKMGHALALAKAYDFLHLIHIEETPCTHCMPPEETPPMPQAACDKCGVITTLESHAGGHLFTCVACRPTPQSCTGPHQWRGSRKGEGVWVCHRCGLPMSSQVIEPDKIVEAPTTPPDVWI